MQFDKKKQVTVSQILREARAVFEDSEGQAILSGFYSGCMVSVNARRHEFEGLVRRLRWNHLS